MASLVGIAIGKGNSLVTLRLLKAASKSSRLDAATLRKRASKRGDSVVDIKLGDMVLGVTSAWQIENYLEIKDDEVSKPASREKTVTKKKTANKTITGTKPKTGSKKKPTRKKTIPQNPRLF